MHVIYDTETSGFKESRLLELGMQLVDEDNKWRPVMELSLIVKPDGWKIEQGAADVHGITQAHAERVGLPLEMVLSIFTKFRQLALLVVCHNLSHDYRVVDKELWRMGWPLLNQSDTAFYCTMLNTVDVCCIPHTSGKRGYKWPTLAEAYRHFFGEDFPNAHSALGDCKPTGKIFRRLSEMGVVAVGSAYSPGVTTAMPIQDICGPPVAPPLVSVAAAFPPPPPAPPAIDPNRPF